eukprot:1175599-Prorocentrum_minimum.AAC.1
MDGWIDSTAATHQLAPLPPPHHSSPPAPTPPCRVTPPPPPLPPPVRKEPGCTFQHPLHTAK